MERKARLALCSLALCVLSTPVAPPRAQVLDKPLTFAFVNGRWFNGKAFSARTVYSVDGTFTLSTRVRGGSCLQGRVGGVTCEDVRGITGDVAGRR
jgi:hypothetical protein